MGHEAVMLPMYLPHVLDEEPADEEQPIFSRINDTYNRVLSSVTFQNG